MAVEETNERATVFEAVLVENAEMCCFPAARRRAARLTIFMVGAEVQVKVVGKPKHKKRTMGVKAGGE